MDTTSVLKWRPRRGLIPAFVLGLVIGPIALSYFGVTVTSRTAKAELQQGIIGLQASLCEAKARAKSSADPAKLDNNARRDLAARHAAMRSGGEVDNEIVGLCSSKLAA